MSEPRNPHFDPDPDKDAGRESVETPDLDRAGGIAREELNPRRSGARPVEQNDRTRDRELQEPTTPP